MKVVARIILLVVAAAAFIYGIPQIIGNWSTVTTIDWSDLQSLGAKLPEVMAALSTLIFAAGFCLLGLLALFEAIVGRISFICFVVAVIMIGLFVWNVITKVQANQLVDFMSWFNVIAGFAMPLGFAVGTLLLILPGKD